EEGGQHADEMTDRGGGELPAAVGRVVLQQLACLETQGLMTVHDPFGVACGARGEGDQCRACGVGGKGALQRFGGEQFVVTVLMLLARASPASGRCPLCGADHTTDWDVRADVGEERAP